MNRNKNKLWILAVVVIIALLIVLCVFTPVFKVVTSCVGNVVAPVQSGITAMTKSVQGMFDGFADNKKLVLENRNLKEEVSKLKNDNSTYLSYKEENERLKGLLDLKNELNEFCPVAASVISKDAGNWFNVFTVNKGKNSSIVENTAVVDQKGLIGRVSQVGENWAKVVTVIDYDHSVSGMISRTEDLVQIDGDLTLMKSGLCKMTVITEGADVIIGDTVVTSGIGGIYPKGLFLGTVIEFKNNSDGTGKYAVVKPDVDFQHIYDVLLLIKAGQ